MAEAQIKELYATKDELIISLEDTLIKSPINGVVRTLNYSIHELAMVGKPLTIIDDVSNLLVKVKVSESDLKKINKETSVLLTISGTQQKVRSRVSKIMPSMNPKTRIGEVEIADLELEDTNNIVLGSSVQAEFVINEENNTLAIPMDSIKQLNNKEVVYVIKGNVVKEVPIKSGIRVGDKAQVLEGLEIGDKIALKNINKLYDGAKVYIFKGEDS
jgi:RND family efflux transporter MFP subunit